MRVCVCLSVSVSVSDVYGCVYVWCVWVPVCVCLVYGCVYVCLCPVCMGVSVVCLGEQECQG